LGGCVAEYGFEIVDEMSLVKVAEIESELGPIGAAARAELFHKFMQAIPADDPLWAGANVVAENLFGVGPTTR